MMPRMRTAVATIVAILVIIVVLQNTQTVETKLLLVTITMPRAVLLFVTLLVGFSLGLITATWLSRRPPKKQE